MVTDRGTLFIQNPHTDSASRGMLCCPAVVEERFGPPSRTDVVAARRAATNSQAEAQAAAACVPLLLQTDDKSFFKRPAMFSKEALETAITEKTVDWMNPWVADGGAPIGIWSVKPLVDTLQTFKDNFAKAPSSRGPDRRAQSVVGSGMGYDEIMPCLAAASPPNGDFIELKFKTGVSVSLARLSRTLMMFGYMDDCVVMDGEPNDAGQLRALESGCVQLAVFKLKAAKEKLGCETISSIVNLVEKMTCDEDVKHFCGKVDVFRFKVEACVLFLGLCVCSDGLQRSFGWLPGCSVHPAETHPTAAPNPANP